MADLASTNIYGDLKVVIDISSQGIVCDWISGNSTNLGGVGGSDSQVQYNNGGSIGGDAGLTWHDTNHRLAVLCDDNQTGFSVVGSNSEYGVKLRIGGTASDTYGYYYRYSGAGSGDANYLEFYTDNATGTDFRHLRYHHTTHVIDSFSTIDFQDSMGVLDAGFISSAKVHTTGIISSQTGMYCNWISGNSSNLGGGAGANTALSNLAAVAINDHLLPDGVETRNLGDASHEWNDFYTEYAYISDNIIHNGDTDTYIAFTTNNITLRAGGSDYLNISSTPWFSSNSLSSNSMQGHHKTPLHASKPTASEHEGELIRVSGSAGVKTWVFMSVKNDADSWEWIQLGIST